MPDALKVFICAGEPSGDLHAAALMESLRKAYAPREIQFVGFGGEAMAAGGAKLFFHTDQCAVMGIIPVLMRLPFLLGMKRRLQEEMLAFKPDMVLTVDYPGMNLRLAGFARAHGIPAVHMVCPQVWAWHRGRIPKIARMLDLLLCFFPFEPELFANTSLNAVFIGHPLVDRAAETRAAPAVRLPWEGARAKIALLPGSRASEIKRHLPVMLKAAGIIRRKLGGKCAFVIPAASAGAESRIREILGANDGAVSEDLHIVAGGARQVLLQASCAAVASGTATLEASLMRCPTVLVYAVNAFTALLARLLIKGVKWIGLANIIAGRQIMPELLQKDFTAEALAAKLLAYLTDAAVRADAERGMDLANGKLGGPGAADRAAQAIRDAFPQL